jgi:hypothetical protein
MRTLLLVFLGTLLLAAGVFTPVWGERLPAQPFIGEQSLPEQSYVRPAAGVRSPDCLRPFLSLPLCLSQASWVECAAGPCSSPCLAWAYCVSALWCQS